MATSTMNLFAGMMARDKGMEVAYQCRNGLVNQVRTHLENIAGARPNHLATADDVESFLISIGMTSKDLGNAAGTIFRHTAWEFTGTWTPSERRSNHGRYIRVWRLK